LPAIRLNIYVQPRASKTEVVGEHGEAIKIRLAAPPVDGAANATLTEFLAARLGLPKAAVKIVGGASSRRKIVEIADVRDVHEIVRLLIGE